MIDTLWLDSIFKKRQFLIGGRCPEWARDTEKRYLSK